MSERTELVRIARSETGYKEGPNNSNKYGAAFGMNKVSWCAIFIWWCAQSARIGTAVIPKLAAVPDFQAVFSKKGRFQKPGSYTPSIGDLVVFDFNSNGIGDHIEIVSKVTDSAMWSIGGNTSSGREDANGDGVWEKQRALSYGGILGYCVPDYKEDDEMMTGEQIVAALSDAQAYKLLVEKANRYAAALTIPEWAEAEFSEAMVEEVTDGTRPMQLIPRYQAAIMAKRAAAKAVK